MFVVMELDPSNPVRLSFKCSPEKYAELTERDGIIPAPYLARYHWVALTRLNALSDAETKTQIGESYVMVRAKLLKNVRRKLNEKRIS